jgi:ADP-dependent NAD(P)H-hydrate dehydratase
MTGAIELAGMATLRSGAGLVTLGVPDACAETVAQFEASYMTTPLPCDSSGRLTAAAKDKIAAQAEQMTCLACGPGLGRSRQLGELVSWMYEVLPQPLVVDADALVVLAERMDRLDEPAGPRVLTPHPGEFRRFVDDAELPRERYEQLAVELAASRQWIIVLKGYQTMVTDGPRVARNDTGNPGMATGGSGDVLTGIITALICQGLPPFEAAQLGTHIHGLAGDLAAAEVGETSLIASDLIRFLPSAFMTLEN